VCLIFQLVVQHECESVDFPDKIFALFVNLLVAEQEVERYLVRAPKRYTAAEIAEEFVFCSLKCICVDHVAELASETEKVTGL